MDVVDSRGRHLSSALLCVSMCLYVLGNSKWEFFFGFGGNVLYIGR